MRLFAAAFCGIALMSVAASAAAATHVRLVEAWAAAPVDPHLAMRITPRSVTQAQDPTYVDIANRLGNLMADQGFNVVGREREPDVDILVEYVTFVLPYVQFDHSTLRDPVYRALVVTAIDAHAPHDTNDIPKVLWQTVVDSYGGSSDTARIIPTLVNYGGRYYGKALTPQGLGPARWCADRIPQLGTLLKPDCPAHPGAPPPPLIRVPISPG